MHACTCMPLHPLPVMHRNECAPDVGSVSKLLVYVAGVRASHGSQWAMEKAQRMLSLKEKGSGHRLARCARLVERLHGVAEGAQRCHVRRCANALGLCAAAHYDCRHCQGLQPCATGFL